MPGKDEDMTTHAIAKDVTPWYREPWPWILFGLPAFVAFVAWLGLRGGDYEQ